MQIRYFFSNSNFVHIYLSKYYCLDFEFQNPNRNIYLDKYGHYPRTQQVPVTEQCTVVVVWYDGKIDNLYRNNGSSRGRV